MAVLGTDGVQASKLLDLIARREALKAPPVVAVENHAGQTVVSGTQEIMDTTREL